MRIPQWLDDARQDVVFALRQLRGTPAFAVVAVATLALGVGVNSAIFALVDAALLRPLPYPSADRVVMLWERTETAPRGGVSPPNLIDWEARSKAIEAIAGFVPGVGGMVMEGRDGASETVPRQWVTSGFFDVLGVAAVAGRTFTADDDVKRARAVVLSEAFWQTRFAGNPGIVGRDLRLDGMPFTVAGVAPRGFQLVGRASMWAVMPITGAPPGARAAHVLQGIGRLAPGATLASATGELTVVADGLAREYPSTNAGRSVTVASLHAGLVGDDLRVTSALLLGVVGAILLICCANVASLLLTRATARSRELAIRAAIGGARSRVIRQLLTESLVLSVLGGAAGAAAGAAILRVVPAVLPPGLLPAAVTVAFDGRVAAFAALATLAVSVLFGVAPAWQATAGDSAHALLSEGRGSVRRGGRLRGALVATELAGAVLLMVGAGLLLRTLLALDQVDRGYRAADVLSLMVDPLGARYPTADSLLQFFDAVELEVRALPGVRDVAWSSHVPLNPGGAEEVSVNVPGELGDARQRPTAGYQVVSPAYFAAIDLPLVSGRAFDQYDTSSRTPVCIVSETFAERLAPGRSPLGLRLAIRAADAPEAEPVVREVVGVARRVPVRPEEATATLQVYVPLAQQPLDDLYLLVRPGAGRAEALSAPVRAAIGRIDKEQLVSVRQVETLEGIARGATARHRFRAQMVGGFALVALTLAMAGVFGLQAYAVQLRSRELAVRRALGARSSDVVAVIASQSCRVIATGLLAGLAGSALVGQALSSVLFGVEPLDPVTFLVVAGALGAAGIAAVVGPVSRAVRIDPAVELRAQE